MYFYVLLNLIKEILIIKLCHRKLQLNLQIYHSTYCSKCLFIFCCHCLHLTRVVACVT